MRSWRRAATGAICALFLGLPVGAAQEVASTQPAMIAPPLDKALAKELAKGKLIEAIERKKPRKAYAPPDRLLTPYAAASVSPAVAYELTEGVDFANAPEAQALCEALVAKLLEGWKGPRPDIKVYITAEASFHGEVRPSGVMLVSLGVFNGDHKYGATGLEELALLLAHELSHVLLGHLDDQKMMNSVADALSVAANSYMTYGFFSESRMVGDQFQAKADPRIVRRGLIANLASQTLVRDLLQPSFGRGKELEADRLAIDLVQRAGFVVSEGTVRDFVDHHAADQAVTTKRMQALATVLRALNEERARQQALKSRDGGLFSEIFQTATREISNQAIDMTLGYIASRNKNHPDPSERIAFDQSYFNQNYPAPAEEPGAPVKRKRTDPRFRQVSETDKTSNLVGRVTKAAVAKNALTSMAGETDPDKSDASMRQILNDAGLRRGAAADRANQAKQQQAAGKKGKAARPPPPQPAPAVATGFGDDNAALTWAMDGLLRDLDGNRDGAMAAWRRGLSTSLPSVDVASRWAQGLPRERRAAELPPVIDRYRTILGVTDPILDLTVAAAMAKGDIAGAETRAAQCMNYRGGALYPKCVEYLGYDPSNKATPARTSEGVAAFQAKGMERGLQLLKPLGDLF